jgi:predicted RNase H-like HicB family nuclease
MTAYIALLRKDPDSDFGVDFPDFPGCVTAGKSLEEARRLAAEALSAHIEAMLEDGETIPEPATLDAIMAEPDNQEAIGFVVDVPSRATRAVRINVTLPEDLIQAIDRRTTNRSRFLADAARQRLESDER